MLDAPVCRTNQSAPRDNYSAVLVVQQCGRVLASPCKKRARRGSWISFTHFFFSHRTYSMTIFWKTRVSRGSSRHHFSIWFMLLNTYGASDSALPPASRRLSLRTQADVIALSETEKGKTQQRNMYFTCAGIRTPYTYTCYGSIPFNYHN